MEQDQTPRLHDSTNKQQLTESPYHQSVHNNAPDDPNPALNLPSSQLSILDTSPGNHFRGKRTISSLKNLKQLQENDARLVKQCLKGDRNSQRELYERHERDMFRICLRYAGSREEAEDMLQDGFVRVFQDLKQFRGEGPLGAWLHKVMVRSALQHLRKNARRPDFVEDIGKLNDLGHEEDLAGRLDAEILTREIQALPRGYRTVFNLFVVEEYTHEEIADTLGISVNTSKSQLHKARAWLKKRLEQMLYSRA